MSAWKLAAKDLRIYFRDRAGVLLGFGLPIGLATVFGAAMGSFSDDDAVGRIRLYVEDRDGSEASMHLLEQLQASDGLSVRTIDLAEIDPITGEDSARDHVAEGDGPAGLLIPAGYEEALARGELPRLAFYRDPGKALEQQIIAASLMPILFEAGGDALIKGALHQGLDILAFPEPARARAAALLDQAYLDLQALALFAGGGSRATNDADAEEGFDFASSMTELLNLEVEDVAGGDEHKEAQKVATQAHAVAGCAVMMLLFGLVACGGTLLEERAEGTLDRLRLAPGATRAILGGKFLFTWIMGLVQLVVLFLYGSLIFDVPILRAPLALGVHSAAVAAAATGFGVLFAVVCTSRKQLEGLSTLVILLMSSMGGSWFPLAMTPEWFQRLGHFTVNAWAMDGYQGIFWYEKDLVGILPVIGVLLGIAAGTSAIAALIWRRRENA